MAENGEERGWLILVGVHHDDRLSLFAIDLLLPYPRQGRQRPVYLRGAPHGDFDRVPGITRYAPV